MGSSLIMGCLRLYWVVLVGTRLLGGRARLYFLFFKSRNRQPAHTALLYWKSLFHAAQKEGSINFQNSDSREAKKDPILTVKQGNSSISLQVWRGQLGRLHR